MSLLNTHTRTPALPSASGSASPVTYQAKNSAARLMAAQIPASQLLLRAKQNLTPSPDLSIWHYSSLCGQFSIRIVARTASDSRRIYERLYLGIEHPD